ncbi:MmcQ-like protein [Polaribacter sp. ALD11]|uniref:MmcQ/YjbR family DNA-binding protein n=1 Tax=Polaribacter sp. ALD11 TaxID=2058137 RepID=UPI000C30A387|nr:MmcQ/YjbR family DNA-binding protein [Polaribacter sp. ALD11]AUC86283.1 MmcQ-like protein [Polaribacter sp. ALD11]
MNIEQLRDFCIAKKGVTEHFPFDEVTLVFKVMGKMFALTSLNNWEKGEEKINLKCDPDKAEELRGQYEGINPGWHMNKRLWNTVTINSSDVSGDLVKELIDHSYDLVVKGLTKNTKGIRQNIKIRNQ